LSYPTWSSSLYQYPHDQLRAITFSSDAELMRALERMWDRQHPLFGVPRDIAAERTLIFPADAVPHLTGIRCRKGSVIPQAEPPVARSPKAAAARE
jgi:mRNA degradation ribonuclease J1/J2